MDIVIKNVPDNIINYNVIDYNSLDKLIDLFLDFKKHNLEDLPENIVSAYENFSEKNLIDLNDKYGN